MGKVKIKIKVKKVITVRIKRKKSYSGIKTVTFFVIITISTVISLNGTLNRRKGVKSVITIINN